MRKNEKKREECERKRGREQEEVWKRKKEREALMAGNCRSGFSFFS